MPRWIEPYREAFVDDDGDRSLLDFDDGYYDEDETFDAYLAVREQSLDADIHHAGPPLANDAVYDSHG